MCAIASLVHMHFIFGLFLELNKSCVEYWLNPYWYKLFHTPSLLLRLWIKYLGLVPGVLLANTSYSIAEMQVAWNFLWKGNENFEHCFRFDHRTYENAGSADFAFKAYQSLSMANTAWLSLYACFLIRETENTYQVFFFISGTCDTPKHSGAMRWKFSLMCPW